ncbi:hypothetical protein ALC57_10670 [Trachymyrmex cornetzi]|uniref:DUF8207 domain-containing protein n=1 Tax=Trachymyrmex cornetzi TaxID=471704 RepID=A0A151J406_9HYME|nr:hypothetical protein ALC57_10670 [Trachymyrmex cornetzi]
MRTDEESRRTSVASFIVHTLTHFVNVPSLLVETLPRFERQPQFMSTIVSQGDLHVTRRANVNSNFQILVARIRQVVTPAQQTHRAMLHTVYIYNIEKRYLLYKKRFVLRTDRHSQYLTSSSFFGGGLGGPGEVNDSMASYTASKVSMCMSSRSSSRSRFHSHVRFSRPLTYTIDYVYGVYLHKDGLMFGNKRFDVDDADNIIIDDVRYAGTTGLYELIFKRISDDALYTEDDMNKYKSMLLATNAHKHKHHSQGRLLSNRGDKYKHIIAPLISMTPKKPNKKSGKGLPRAMTLNDNAIDYVHWDDPNELVDRLRLLDASHRAGNNAHDNEMLSIIEELREAGLIIN